MQTHLKWLAHSVRFWEKKSKKSNFMLLCTKWSGKKVWDNRIWTRQVLSWFSVRDIALLAMSNIDWQHTHTNTHTHTHQQAPNSITHPAAVCTWGYPPVLLVRVESKKLTLTCNTTSRVSAYALTFVASNCVGAGGKVGMTRLNGFIAFVIICVRARCVR